MKYLFRGWVTKNWKNNNDVQSETIHEINKILVRNSVQFYLEAWKQKMIYCMILNTINYVFQTGIRM